MTDIYTAEPRMIKRPPGVMSGCPFLKVTETLRNTGAIQRKESYSRINLSTVWLSNLPAAQHRREIYTAEPLMIERPSGVISSRPLFKVIETHQNARAITKLSAPLPHPFPGSETCLQQSMEKQRIKKSPLPHPSPFHPFGRALKYFSVLASRV